MESDRKTDRRVRRSRAALMRAAVDLVTERGTTAIAVSDLARAADVSRQLVYLQFGDRDTLLLEAALDLARRDLVKGAAPGPADVTGPGRLLAATEHFARYRAFYRAMVTGPCGYALTAALSDLLSPFSRLMVDRMTAGTASPELAEDLTRFVVGGWAASINTWLVESPDPLDAEAFAARLGRMVPVLTGSDALPTPP
ncbi:TetR/AcrR family transcriptional regulator [Nocardiopsis sp. CC223A]|uniref:TetR/AcrR family transcriptional regulator n=1 Tax=Nocardiopsis sp. CC223A TaxID=3044051 RepID=UPI002795FDF5|nr:TetR/AcrR family transcriptional regulator [Nocardiopsis sp. CC223A]